MDDSQARPVPATAADTTPDAQALHAVLGNVSSMVVACREDGTVVFAGGAMTAFLGYDEGAVLGRSFANYVHPEDLARAAEGLARWHGRNGSPVGSALRLLHTDGSYRPFHFATRFGDDIYGPGSFIVTLRPIDIDETHNRLVADLIANGDRIVRMASTFLDIDPDAFDDGLAAAVNELASLNAVTRVTVWMVDEDRLDRVARWDADLGAPTIDPPIRLHSGRSPMLKTLLAGTEVRFTPGDESDDEFAGERAAFGEAGTVSLLAVPVAIRGAVVGVLILESTLVEVAFGITHVTSARSAAAIIAAALVRQDTEAELAERARLDPTTGLSNRWFAQSELQRALDRLENGESRGVAIAMIDLDRFKLVNEALGHQTGDRLLREVASRFAGIIDDDIELARLSADDFFVLIPDIGCPQQATDVVKRLLDTLSAPVALNGSATSVSATAGIVHFDTGRLLLPNAEEALRRLETTLDRAKETGSGIEVGDETDDRHLARLRRIGELQRAIERDELIPYFQAEWDLVSGRIVGAEALVRWQHPIEGLVGANEIVPLAESSGLVSRLGRQMLLQATRVAAQWLVDDPDFLLRVNISAQQLRNTEFVDEVAWLLAESNYPAASLCLELTESMLLDDPFRSGEQFTRLRELGVGLAIDDFGTGYSSVLQLKELPLTSLKIDQRFVAGLGTSNSDRAIVEATLELAEAFEVTATAEGVETEAQRAALLEMGCNHAQGFLLSKPEGADVFAQRLADQVASNS